MINYPNSYQATLTVGVKAIRIKSDGTADTYYAGDTIPPDPTPGPTVYYVNKLQFNRALVASIWQVQIENYIAKTASKDMKAWISNSDSFASNDANTLAILTAAGLSAGNIDTLFIAASAFPEK